MRTLGSHRGHLHSMKSVDCSWGLQLPAHARSSVQKEIGCFPEWSTESLACVADAEGTRPECDEGPPANKVQPVFVFVFTSPCAVRCVSSERDEKTWLVATLFDTRTSRVGLGAQFDLQGSSTLQISDGRSPWLR